MRSEEKGIKGEETGIKRKERGKQRECVEIAIENGMGEQGDGWI